MLVYPFVCTQASDGVVSSPKKTDPYDIDTPDSCNELAVVEYVEDIYRFYKSTEVRSILL
jgi:cyclin B